MAKTRSWFKGKKKAYTLQSIKKGEVTHWGKPVGK